jgi:pimeloyl-ACP methyl ester carboxylesterase
MRDGEAPAAAFETDSFVQVGGVRLETRRWGASETPILLLHEGLGSVSAWRDFPASLAAATGRGVIAWSRSGYGLSDAPDHSFEPDYMHREAAKLPALLDMLSVERAHLYGHSDGGSIALLAASSHPERVASLTLAAPHVFVEPITVESIAEIRDVYRSSDLKAKLARHHRDADRVFWRWNDIWLDPRFLAWNIEDVLAGVVAPALLIQGLDDEYGTLEQIDRIEAGLGSLAKRLVLPGCGHAPHRDQRARVLSEVAAFTGALSRGR